MGEEWKEGSYQHALGDSLLMALEQWRKDRSASWSNELGSNDILEKCEDLSNVIQPFGKREIFKEAEDFVRRIFKSSPGAGDSGPLTDGGADREAYYDCQDFLRYTREGIEFCLAGPLIRKLGGAASRWVDLSQEELWRIEALKLSKSAMEFWRLIKDSYIWGFNAPCVIICRSVIEDILRSKIDYETCEKHLGTRRGRQPGFCLPDYVEVARRESLISDDVATQAHTIRERANKVLHNDPGLTEKTRESISQTVRILCVIETGKDPRRPEL